VNHRLQLLDEAPQLQLGLHLVFTNVGTCALAANAASNWWTVSDNS